VQRDTEKIGKAVVYLNPAIPTNIVRESEPNLVFYPACQ